jgi:hypothetical protein
VTGRKPHVPRELAELISLMSALGQPLPLPANGPAGYAPQGSWEAREERELCRESVLGFRLHVLADELERGPQNPAVEAELLAQCCRRQAAAIREELAKPLGYEPRPAREGPSESYEASAAEGCELEAGS